MESAWDYCFETTAGGQRRLDDYRGRVTVLVWERRECVEQNRQLKRDLDKLAADPGVGGRVAVVAVADVGAYDFAPARTFVRSAVRALARRARLEILLDWKGALVAAPFRCTPGASNLLVLDPGGNIVFRSVGPVSPAQRVALFDLLRQLLESRAA